MLKKTIAICALTVFALIGLQAANQETPSSNPIEIPSDEDMQQEGLSCEKNNQDKQEALACKKCKHLLAGEKEDEQNTLACKKRKHKHHLTNKEDEQVELACNVEEEEQEEIIPGKEKDLTPGALVCNGSEYHCTKDGNKEESVSSKLFSVFNDDKQDEENLLACKDCR
jgi:hypothetical protein